MGIKEGLTEIWEDLMSYRTLKVVKISDKRLAYVHKTLMASILVYSTISMIGGQGLVGHTHRPPIHTAPIQPPASRHVRMRAYLFSKPLSRPFEKKKKKKEKKRRTRSELHPSPCAVARTCSVVAFTHTPPRLPVSLKWRRAAGE